MVRTPCHAALRWAGDLGLSLVRLGDKASCGLGRLKAIDLDEVALDVEEL